MKKILKEIYPYIIIVIVVVLIRTFIVTPILVSGKSMFPNLSGGELMILNKLSKKIERYDIVVVSSQEEDHIIKRVYGLPGDRILCKDNTIYINNKKIEDKYGYGITEDFELIKLDKDEYFVLGDNRTISKDSRMIGPVKKENIQGTTSLVIYPFNKIGFVK